jgi:two-component system LytT family response regulator
VPEHFVPLRVAIVDDEPMARATLRKLLAEDPEVELVAELSNGEEALRTLPELAPDVVFLDVQMPGRTGFEVVAGLQGPSMPLVVFVTAYDQYALKAFDVHAVDYLLKPFDDERFRTALERAKERLRQERVLDVAQDLSGLMGSLELRPGAEAAAPFPERLAIHREGRVDWVDVAGLRWVEAADQYVKLHTSGGLHLMRESMHELERRLDPRRFLRVHRSAIVALEHVRSFERQPSGGGRLLLDQGEWLPVSRSRAGALVQRLG